MMLLFWRATGSFAFECHRLDRCETHHTMDVKPSGDQCAAVGPPRQACLLDLSDPSSRWRWSRARRRRARRAPPTLMADRCRSVVCAEREVHLQRPDDNCCGASTLYGKELSPIKWCAHGCKRCCCCRLCDVCWVHSLFYNPTSDLLLTRWFHLFSETLIAQTGTRCQCWRNTGVTKTHRSHSAIDFRLSCCPVIVPQLLSQYFGIGHIHVRAAPVQCSVGTIDADRQSKLNRLSPHVDVESLTAVILG